MSPEQWIRVNRVYRGVSIAGSAVGLVLALSYAADGDADGAALLGGFTFLCLAFAVVTHRRVVGCTSERAKLPQLPQPTAR